MPSVYSFTNFPITFSLLHFSTLDCLPLFLEYLLGAMKIQRTLGHGSLWQRLLVTCLTLISFFKKVLRSNYLFIYIDEKMNTYLE